MATLEEAAVLFAGGDTTPYYRFVANDLPVDLVVTGGEVTAIRQQYVP